MRLSALLTVVAVAFFTTTDATTIIDHDAVAPFVQPTPVTISEKAGVKYNPILDVAGGCFPYPAVNAAGEITGGLKGTKETSGCDSPPAGSQVYGRAASHNNKYAIMYAWYFPKGYDGWSPSRRHDWASVVLWIDNPDLANPSILGLSGSKSDTEYAPLEWHLHGTALSLIRVPGSVQRDITSTTGKPEVKSNLYPTTVPLSLIMWDQLTDEARSSLNTVVFGDCKVPFNDVNFEANLVRPGSRRRQQLDCKAVASVEMSQGGRTCKRNSKYYSMHDVQM